MSRQKRIFFLTLLLVVALSLLPIEFFPDEWLGKRISDIGHIPAYAVLTAIIALRGFADTVHKGLRIAISATGAIVLAGALEIVQPWFGREGNLPDLIRSSIGIGLAVLLASLIYSNRPRKSFALLAVLFLAVLAYATLPLFDLISAMNHERSRFPALANFEHEYETELWSSIGRARIFRSELVHPEKFSKSGKHALGVTSKKGRYSGVEYRGAIHDWSNQSVLQFTVINPREPFELSMRIDDARDCEDFDNRFNKKLQINRGLNRVNIPLSEIAHGPKNRTLELEHITAVMFFTPPESAPRTFFLDDIRLE